MDILLITHLAHNLNNNLLIDVESFCFKRVFKHHLQKLLEKLDIESNK